MKNILLEKFNTHAVKIILNRPEKHNALSSELIGELLELLEKIQHDSAVKILCLASSGKHFCAGGDLSDMQKLANAPLEENLRDAENLSKLMQALYDFPKPTIALIHGAAIGGGAGLVACCDIAIAADNSYFGFTEARLGILPAVISPYIINAIGARHARRYFLTTELFDAEKAREIGLIHEVVEAEKLIFTAEKYIAQLEKNSPAALKEIKQLFSPIAENQQEKLAKLLATMRASKHGQEGLRAFLEKRPPLWPE